MKNQKLLPFVKKATYALFLFVFISVSGCKKILNDSVPGNSVTDGIQPYNFNWETANWMPTPPGQSLIPPPWIGQGSITSVYGLDVANDNKYADGWQLVYNTFDPNSAGPLQNPYFILYNKYRGLMRIYIYITTPLTYPSDYLVDGLNVLTTGTSSMLNFLGTDIVNVSQNQLSYTQVEPAPKDGSAPLGSNKWYMLQYELAYDPQTANTNYNNIQLSWFNNYNSISKVSLGGPLQGTLNGTVGSSTSGINSAIQNGVNTITTAGLSLIGSSVLNNASGSFQGVYPEYTSDGTLIGYTPATSNNNLGLPDGIFTSLKTGLSNALSAASGNIPGAIAGILSAIIGGSSNATTVSLNLNAKLRLDGTSTSQGSFPASPTSVYVPGSIIDPISAPNYIPLYNQSLGVFNLSNKPTINVHTSTSTILVNEGGIDIPFTQYTNLYTVNQGLFNSLFITNPAVVKSLATGATIQNLNTQVVLLNPNTGYNFQVTGTQEIYVNYTAYTGTNVTTVYSKEHGAQPINDLAAIRVSFDVIPNNGTTPKSTIIKSFFANIVNN